ncbi:MAG: FtsL-like putative cell division protein [Marinifilaceae bacterium]
MGWFKKSKIDEEARQQLGIKEIFIASINSLLNGRLLISRIQKHKGAVALAFLFCLLYIYQGFKVERLFSEKARLENEVMDLRFISNTVAADLMFSKKKSEVDKKVAESGLSVQNSKEPPYRIYER